MERLIDLVQKEFSTADYQIVGENGVWTDCSNKDFWIVVTIEGDYDIEEEQEKLFERTASLRDKYSAMEKNTSLLILNILEDVNQKNAEKVISDENNPYYFKKYVLQYTDQEWKDIKPFLVEKTCLSDALMDVELFKKLKEAENGEVALLYGIAHKLPFIMMGVKKKTFVQKEKLFLSAPDLLPLCDWIDSINSTGEMDDLASYINSYLNSDVNE